MSYTAPRGQAESTLEDLSYDGVLDGNSMRGGLGQLVDGLYGDDHIQNHTPGKAKLIDYLCTQLAFIDLLNSARGEDVDQPPAPSEFQTPFFHITIISCDCNLILISHAEKADPLCSNHIL